MQRAATTPPAHHRQVMSRASLGASAMASTTSWADGAVAATSSRAMPSDRPTTERRNGSLMTSAVASRVNG